MKECKKNIDKEVEKMIVFRFMSNNEFQKFRCSNKLKNSKTHKARTDSVGFCFFDIEDFKPEEAFHFLSGNVSSDICAVFETDEKLNKTYGVYAKPLKPDGDIISDLINLFNGWRDEFTATEYCCTEYSNKTFKLIKYTKNIWEQWDRFEEQQEFKWEVCDELQNTKRLKKKNGERT